MAELDRPLYDPLARYYALERIVEALYDEMDKLWYLLTDDERRGVRQPPAPQ